MRLMMEPNGKQQVTARVSWFLFHSFPAAASAFANVGKDRWQAFELWWPDPTAHPNRRYIAVKIARPASRDRGALTRRSGKPCSPAAPVFQRQRHLLGGHHAVTPATLGLIECRVGGCQQNFEFGARRTAGHANTDGGVDRSVGGYDSRGGEGLAHP